MQETRQRPVAIQLQEMQATDQAQLEETLAREQTAHRTTGEQLSTATAAEDELTTVGNRRFCLRRC